MLGIGIGAAPVRVVVVVVRDSRQSGGPFSGSHWRRVVARSSSWSGPAGQPGAGSAWRRLNAWRIALGPGPVGREVQGDSAGVAGELPGDVQDPVAQPLGLADLVLAVEREQLRPDHHVVRGERELEPRGVRVEGVERQVVGAGRLERLDAILDLGVLAVE